MRIPARAVIGAVAASLVAATGAGATDLYVEPPYAGTYGAPPAPARDYVPPPVYAPPPAVAAPVVPGPVVEERCRVRHKVTVDAWGREVVRRLRICDEGVVERYPGPPRYGEYAPRPPANVGEGYRERDVYRDAPPRWREPDPPEARRDWRDDGEVED